MENYRGDLADIIRSSSGPIEGGSDGFSCEFSLPDWRFPDEPVNYMEEAPVDDFGDPFSCLRDPLLHELDIPGSGFFTSLNNSAEMMKTSATVEDTTGVFGSGRGGRGVGGIILDREVKRPANFFTRMLQISPDTKLREVSPCESPVGIIKASSPLINPNHDLISASTSKSCLIENTGSQISSPRNTGIKRRKSQAKKVVCIPAPAPANNRPSTGEVVPSDLWAWRKYGQKPIKGSPYPRGYYRCSSSKGCSARKQVERSRTDPNMLVITYTSDHNHPWPTQRNALAGSTRSQPSKATSASSKNNSNNPNSPAAPQIFQTGTPSLKEEEEDNHDPHHINAARSNSMLMVKEDMEELERDIEMENGDHRSGGDDQFRELRFPSSYRPLLPESTQCDQDFFAELGEIEADPLNRLFTHGFSGKEHKENNNNNKASLDSFASVFDWTDNSITTTSNNNSTLLGEAKWGL